MWLTCIKVRQSRKKEKVLKSQEKIRSGWERVEGVEEEWGGGLERRHYRGRSRIVCFIPSVHFPDLFYVNNR